MELILVIVTLGAIQLVSSTPALYNNELNQKSYSNYKYNSVFNPESSFKTSWLSSTKQLKPSYSKEEINEVNKFPFNLKQHNSNWNNKVIKSIEKKELKPVSVSVLEIEEIVNEETLPEDYENVTIILSEEDLVDRIDPAVMCSLLGRCIEDQQ